MLHPMGQPLFACMQYIEIKCVYRLRESRRACEGACSLTAGGAACGTIQEEEGHSTRAG